MTESETYTYSWTCKSCAHQNSFERTKYQAAFEHRPTIPPCDQCGGTTYYAASTGLPDIDLELLEMWAADDDLYFLEQDEDLVIAGTSVSVLKAYLNNKPDDKSREALLIWVFVLKLYDGNFDTQDDRDWCIQFLRERPEKWGDTSLGYVWKRVLPILNETGRLE